MHLLRSARAEFGFDDGLFGPRGDVVFADPYAAHEFARTINEKRGDGSVWPSQAHAMGLIHEVMHALIAVYCDEVKPGVLGEVLARLRTALGSGLPATMLTFVETYPPPSVYRGEQSAPEFLRGSLDDIPNEQWVLEELVLLWVANQNPAYAPLSPLITDEPLKTSTRYLSVIESLTVIFQDEPRFGAGGESLLDALLAPIRHAPSSLAAQLDYIRTHWGERLAKLDAWRRLLVAVDSLKEEATWFMRRGQGGGHPEPSTTPFAFRGDLYEAEPEAFSADLDWMPRVVMIAKSSFVWLDQLSKRYGREIRTLDAIPDDEIATLASRGISALWLIGLWRRSDASRKIKQIHGDRDAVASAYSLHDYEIAPELGGYDAYKSLRDRAAAKGVRLASDMVPNHMGVDSSWVMNHPDWFVQSDRPPFPGYSFNGPDLSGDERVGIFLEDGYWNRTDAAVVFKRFDRWTGDARYVYHGNDGTSMPWNDTAQLDYLKAEVREAVIQTILHVARLFPIIRFDAAMTLAKRHYQRLWFPLPGSGGDIPSRASHAMTKEQFDAAFPVEFWREVVDRVAAEAPQTLLLAEAFWMMEGYFVRTLGMHRVYNSAFMNMLKREENASFRTSTRNVLEYNPQILKRHVNFMNNPDEETAVAQFGKDDKYFGVCTLMCTMPGLPMFGHGQIEGFTEKYGMEYQRAKYDEKPDGWLVGRHEREIFPLLRRRHLFADVERFTFYDFETPEGHVDEDVIAYSNHAFGEATLVVYHNKYKHTRGTLRMSCGYLGPSGGIERRSLVDGLGLRVAPGVFTVMRDHATGLEYLRENEALARDGFWIELGAFKYQVLWDMREVVEAADAPYAALGRELAGRGAASIADALVDHRFRAIHLSFWEAVSPGSAEYLASGWESDAKALKPEVVAAVREKLEHLTDGVRALFGAVDPPAGAAGRVRSLLRLVAKDEDRDAELARPGATLGLHVIALGVTWIFEATLEEMHESIARGETDERGAFEAWRLDRVVVRAMLGAGVSEDRARQLAELVGALAWAARDPALTSTAFTRRALDSEATRELLGKNTYEGVAYLRKEGLETLLDGFALVRAIDGVTVDIEPVLGLAAAAGYEVVRMGKLLAATSPVTRGSPSPTREDRA